MQQQETHGAAVMPFGKYKGTDIRQLPTEYLRYAVEKLGGLLDDATVEAIMEEFRRRNGVYGFENSVGDGRASLEGRELRRAAVGDLVKAWQDANREFQQALGVTLPPCRISVRTNAKILGTWYPGLRILTISNYWILPRRALQSVIIHEMCHQYITDMHINDTAPHGKMWKEVAAAMEAQTGLQIRKETRTTGFVANDKRRSEPDMLYFYE